MIGQVKGKGCFEPDTKVLMADGALKEIQLISSGDSVASWDGLKVVNATVCRAVTFLRKERIVLHIESSGKQIVSTPDHPYWSQRSQTIVSFDPHQTFVDYDLDALDMLELGEIFEDTQGSGIPVHLHERYNKTEATPVMTLQLSETHWFFVEGVRVHNKGSSGCFLGDTKVTLSNGRLEDISKVGAGDIVLSWDEELGQFKNASVVELLEYERKELMEVYIDRIQGSDEMGPLISTPDHPYWSVKQKAVVSLNPGATIQHYKLQCQLMHETEIFRYMDGSSVTGRARMLPNNESTRVFTLALQDTHWFFAQGILVHNKGSSSGGSSSTGSSTTRTTSTGGTYYSSGTSYSSNRYVYSTVIIYSSSRYYYSSRCMYDQYAVGCRYSTVPESSIVCGCLDETWIGNGDEVEAEIDSTKAKQNIYRWDLCPSDDLENGICYIGSSSLSNNVPSCIPRLLPSTVSYDDMIAYNLINPLAWQNSSCYNDNECASFFTLKYLRNTTLSRRLFLNPAIRAVYVNGSSANVAVVEQNAFDAYEIVRNASLFQSREYCECDFEMCDETDSISLAIIASFVVILMVIVGATFCICICKNYAKNRVIITPEGLVSTGSVQACTHSSHPLSAVTCSEMAARGDASYRDGFICDVCNGSFPFSAEFKRCNICRVDYCQGCAVKFKTPVAIPQVTPVFTPQQTCHHVFEAKMCSQLVQQGQTDYKDGFGCDTCNRGFPNTVPFHQCLHCHLDFCEQCRNRSAPQNNAAVVVRGFTNQDLPIANNAQ